jgi:outer membrane protein assembly factor BamB
MMSRNHLAILLGILLHVGAPADLFSQSNWPHVRGPNYDAISTETGLVESWPEGGPPVLWSIDLGQGYSGFVVGDGRLFTQFQSKTSQYVVALDPDSGAEIWRIRVGSPWQPLGAYPGPYATPTWHDNRVYFTTPMGKVGCLNANDGREIWSLNLRQKFGLKGVEFGYAATPLVEDGKVIAAQALASWLSMPLTDRRFGPPETIRPVTALFIRSHWAGVE